MADKEGLPFGKKLLAAIPKGLGLGALFYLITAGINGVLGLWTIQAEVVLAIVGFALAISEALLD
jgi:hypothetical protein